MWKKYFLFIAILFFSIFFSGCTNNFIENDSFSKKQECAQYSDEMIRDMKLYIGSIEPLDKIIYSKNRDSCLYAYSKANFGSNSDFIESVSYYIMDYFTKELVFYGLHMSDDTYDIEGGREGYKKKIEELENLIN